MRRRLPRARRVPDVRSEKRERARYFLVSDGPIPARVVCEASVNESRWRDAIP